jgi:hypothetical protein
MGHRNIRIVDIKGLEISDPSKQTNYEPLFNDQRNFLEYKRHEMYGPLFEEFDE